MKWYLVISVLDLKKSNQIQNIQRFDLDLKSFLTQWCLIWIFNENQGKSKSNHCKQREINITHINYCLKATLAQSILAIVITKYVKNEPPNNSTKPKPKQQNDIKDNTTNQQKHKSKNLKHCLLVFVCHCVYCCLPVDFCSL